MDKITKDLQLFYDKEAEKYYFSRKKFWHDWIYIKELINKIGKKKITLLEFWCGGWRLLDFLENEFPDINFIYTGVDISKELLNLASKNRTIKNCTFVCDDIVHYVTTLKQEHFDLVIWLASFQHITSRKARVYLMQYFYKILKFDWYLFMINWSFSSRFIKKYKTSLFASIKKNILSFWKYDWKDLYLPWKSGIQTFERFYHIFLKKELLNLSRFSGFITLKVAYLNKQWKMIDSWRDSKNTIFLAKKDIFL